VQFGATTHNGDQGQAQDFVQFNPWTVPSGATWTAPKAQFIARVGSVGQQAFRVVLRADSAGSPGSLIAVSSEVIATSTDAVLYDALFPTPPSLSPGTVIHIGLWCGPTSSACLYRNQNPSEGGTTGRYQNNSTYSSTGDPPAFVQTNTAATDVYVPVILTGGTPVANTVTIPVESFALGPPTADSPLKTFTSSYPQMIYRVNRPRGDTTIYTFGSVTAQTMEEEWILEELAKDYGLLTELETANISWNPLVRQEVEADTIYLFDPEVETTFAPALGGWNCNMGQFVSYANCNPWNQSTSFMQVIDGKFRKGVRGASAGSGNTPLYMPGAWLPPNEFTVEFWCRGDNNWNGADPCCFVAFGHDGNESDCVSLNFRRFDDQSYRMQLRWGDKTTQPTSGNRIVDTHDVLAGQWVNYAATLKDGTLRLYFNGVQVGSIAITTPFAWEGEDQQGALSILPWGGITDNSQWSLSDLRISRKARVPNNPVTVSSVNTAFIADTTTSGQTVNQNLRGALHNCVAVDADVSDTTLQEGLFAGPVKLGRTGKVMQAVPIKAGGTDATHPTLGHSGSYSYDWRPVDHQLAYYARVGMDLYLNFDACPQIFGGSVAPFTPTQCADVNHLPAASDYSTAVPNNFAGYATVAADLYYYITVTKATPVRFAGFGNEPDGGTSFWAGTQTQFFDLYKATANAIVAVDPSANVGGPEVGAVSASSWVQPFIQYCAANSVPLKHISYHHYNGDPNWIGQFKARIAQWVALYSLPNTPDLIIGEASIHSYLVPGTVWPWREPPFNFGLNDWNASYTAMMLIAAQRSSVKAYIHTNCGPTELGDGGWGSMGFVSKTNHHRWPIANVYDIWKKLGTDVMDVSQSSSLDLEGGVFLQASKDPGSGRTTILLVNHKYRMDRTTKVRLTIPSRIAGYTITRYLVDTTHSNKFDTPAASGALETVPAPAVNGTTLDVVMTPRSVTLLEFTP
jgi:hypothetical protein